mmetsp:Transcript_37479/g.37828  ORF Transcript_37479/g.37828 Transcript_37479/m.37828 type:complete len:81 (-) Transcript_37479:1116-1358(-)
MAYNQPSVPSWLAPESESSANLSVPLQSNDLTDELIPHDGRKKSQDDLPSIVLAMRFLNMAASCALIGVSVGQKLIIYCE